MNPSAQTSPPSVASQTTVTPAEKLVAALVLVILLAWVAFGAVLSAKALHQRVLAGSPVTSALFIRNT